MVKASSAGTYTNWLTSTGWETASNVLLGKTANVNTLAAGSRCLLLVRIGPAYSAKFQGKVTASTKNVAGITLTGTDPVSIESTSHGFATGDTVTFADIVGTTELNGNSYTITKTDANNYTLDDTDSSEYTAYVSGGTGTVSDTSVTIKGTAVQK